MITNKLTFKLPFNFRRPLNVYDRLGRQSRRLWRSGMDRLQAFKVPAFKLNSDFAARWVKLWRAAAVKLALLLAIFVAVPFILYGQFRAADEEKQQILLKSAQEQGRLVVVSITPLLTRFDPATSKRLGELLNQISSGDTNIKVLLRPKNATSADQFYYVASAPTVSAAYLAAEQKQLGDSGVLKRVPATCREADSTVARYTNPGGKEELLVSLNAVNTTAGCWVIITSSAAADFLGTGIGRPYWKTPEIRLASLIYLMMAVFVVLLFLDGARSLRRFTDLARRIRTRGGEASTFAALNQVPELDSVAREFDGMVGSLRQSAELIRFTAEDNAHAFKTPIAVISQSLEPLKRAVKSGNERGARAIEMIENSVHRLDILVSAARQMDEAAAEIIDPSREAIDVAELLRRMGDAYSDALSDRGIKVLVDADQSVVVLAQEDSLDTVLENIVENAASFSKPGDHIRLAAHPVDGMAVITVDDSGPGVNEPDLERMFERYFSKREATGSNEDDHFGVGLWIVRRNIEVIGGSVDARNLDAGGLRMSITLPLA